MRYKSVVDRTSNSLDNFDEQSRRPWGFLVFVLTVLMLASAIDRPAGSPRQAVVAAVMPLTVAKAGTDGNGMAVVGRARSQQTPLQPELGTQRVSPKNAVARTSKVRGTRNVVAFESSSIVTTEGAVAAVFVIQRSPPLDGRMRVQWSARSGTADAAIDFSDASGTAVLADGQATAALYVPLRNDLLQEADETFKVCLDSSLQADSRPFACAEATIRDDDELLSRR